MACLSLGWPLSEAGKIKVPLLLPGCGGRFRENSAYKVLDLTLADDRCPGRCVSYTVTAELTS